MGSALAVRGNLEGAKARLISAAQSGRVVAMACGLTDWEEGVGVGLVAGGMLGCDAALGWEKVVFLAN
jgi:hypothetical protein